MLGEDGFKVVIEVDGNGELGFSIEGSASDLEVVGALDFAKATFIASAMSGDCEGSA